MKTLTLISGLAFVAAAVFAQTSTPAAPRAQKTLVYLTPAQIDPSRLLEPPAKDGSEMQQREMAAVKRLIKARTPERFAQAKWDAAHEDATPFAATIGPAFDLQKLPATARLLQSVLADQAIAASTAKDYFHRKFPVTAEMPSSYGEWTCDTVDRKPDSRPLRSYPSGHANPGLFRGSGSSRPHPREIPGDFDAGGRLRVQPRGVRRSLSQRRGGQPRVGHGGGSLAGE